MTQPSDQYPIQAEALEPHAIIDKWAIQAEQTRFELSVFVSQFGDNPSDIQLDQARRIERTAEQQEACDQEEKAFFHDLPQTTELAVFTRRTLGSVGPISLGVQTSPYAKFRYAPTVSIELDRLIAVGKAKNLVGADFPDPSGGEIDRDDYLKLLAVEFGKQLRTYRWAGSDGDPNESWESGLLFAPDGTLTVYTEELKAQEEARIEAARLEELQEYGLPETATWEEIISVREDRQRQSRAEALGLPSDATLTQILDATYSHAEG